MCVGAVLSCSDLPLLIPHPPGEPTSALVGISIRTKATTSEKILNLGIDQAEFPHVAFVKIGDGEGIRSASTWFPSNYQDDERVYLLNAEPGEYVAAAIRSVEDITGVPGHEEVHRFTFLSEDVIEMTRVTVRPGGIVFMGEFVVDRKGGTDSLDPAQQHYRELLVPGVKSHEDVWYRGVLREGHQDRDTEEKFFRKTAKRFKGSPWVPIIEAHLKELEAK
jgi:hypothetical protein